MFYLIQWRGSLSEPSTVGIRVGRLVSGSFPLVVKFIILRGE